MNKLQEELLGITQLRLVAVEAFEHLELVDFRQYLQKPPQFFRTDVIVATLLDQLDYILVRTRIGNNSDNLLVYNSNNILSLLSSIVPSELLEEDVNIQTPFPVE